MLSFSLRPTTEVSVPTAALDLNLSASCSVTPSCTCTDLPSGTAIGANTGTSMTSGLVQLGQAVGAVGDPALIATDRIIPFPAFPAAATAIKMTRDLSAYSPLYPNASTLFRAAIIEMDSIDGGHLYFNAQDSTNVYGDLFTSIQYFVGGTLQAFSGLHYTPSDKHYDIVDIRGVMASAQIQVGGNGMAIFKSDGNVFLGGTGVGKVTIGRLVTGGTAKLNVVTSTAAAAPFRIENIGAIIPTSPNNGDIWITAPTTPQHLFARLDGVTYQLDQQVGAQTWEQTLTTQGATPFVANHTVNLEGKDLILMGQNSIQFGGGITDTSISGPIAFPNLTNITSQNTLIGKNSTDGIGYVTIASPLNLTSGVLGITASAATMPINNLLSATGSNQKNHGAFSQEWQWNAGLTDGFGLALTSSTTGALNSDALQVLLMTGANASSSIITTALSVTNTHTGTSSINRGIAINTAGATNNYAIVTSAGSIGFGTTTPTAGVLHLVIPTTTASTTASGVYEAMNSLTTGTGHYIASSSVTSGKIIDLVITGTAGTDGQTGVNISLSGALGGAGPHATYGVRSDNVHTTSSPIITNYGGYFSSSGGTINYGVAGVNTTINSAANRAGYFLGNITIASANTVGNNTASILDINGNSLTTGTAVNITGTGISTGHLIDLTLANTTALTGQTALSIILSGVNATGGQTTYGVKISNTHSGTSTNIGMSIATSGGSNNYPLQLIDGNQGSGKVLTSDTNGNANWQTPSSFGLSNGSGTTVNGTTLDWTGTLTTNANIDGDGNTYEAVFSSLTGFRVGGGVYTTTSDKSGFIGFNTTRKTGWLGDYNSGTPENNGTYLRTDDDSKDIYLITQGNPVADSVGIRLLDGETNAASSGYVWTLLDTSNGLGHWAVTSLVIGSPITGGSIRAVLYENDSNLLGEDVSNFSYRDSVQRLDVTNIQISGNSNIGTVTGGTWNGTAIGVPYGGTGATSYTTGAVLVGNGTTNISSVADVAVGSYLRSGGVATNPLWSTLILPNAATANRLVYATSTNTYGESANLTFDGNKMAITSNNTISNTSSSSLYLALTALTSGTGMYVTANSLTSGNFMQLVSTSTALIANNEILDIQVSGINASNAITATGARISVTNTNATSGTNVGLEVTASGATTANWALDAIGNLRVTSANTTQTTTGSAFVLAAASLTTGIGIYSRLNALTTGSIMNLLTTGSALDTNATIAYFQMGGSTSGASKTTYGVRVENTNTGTTNTNIGIDVQVSGGTTANYAARFVAPSGASSGLAILVPASSGRVAIGVSTANASLDVVGTAILDSIQTASTGGNSDFFVVGATTASGTSTATLLFAGASTVDTRVIMNGTTATTLGTGRSYSTLIIGASAITEFSSGVHVLIASVVIKAPTVTGGVATVTNSATLYIESAPSVTVTGLNMALWVDDGIVRIDGNTLHGVTTDNGTQLQTTSLSVGIVGKSANYTLTAADSAVNATSGTFTFTLPTAVGISGRIYFIKNSGAGSITVATTSSQTIDGVTTQTLGTQYLSITVMSDGANWIIL